MGLSLKIKPGDKDFEEKSQELIGLIRSIRLSSKMKTFKDPGYERIGTEPFSTGEEKKRNMFKMGEGIKGRDVLKDEFLDYDDPAYIQSQIQLKVNELFHDGMNIAELRPEKFYMPDYQGWAKLFPRVDRYGLELKIKQAEEVFSDPPEGLPKEYQNLANLLLMKHKGKLRLDKERLKKFISFLGWDDYVIDVHPTDVMFNPAVKDFDVFSFTTGDVEKVGPFYLDLMEFLSEFNKEKLKGSNFDSYVTLHFTTYEEFKNLEGKVKFGSPTADGSREAQYRGHLVLKFLEENFKGNNVRLGVETGPGLRQTKYGRYFIENEPYFFLGLLKDRKIAKLIHDFAHGEFKTSDNKQVKHILYAVERIGKYHVSGNTKDEKTLEPIDDSHEPPSPSNLSTYWDTITLAKIVSPNIVFSPEFTIKKPEDVEIIEKYFEHLSSKLSKEDKQRYEDWVDTLEKANLSFHHDNLDKKKIEELMKY